MVGKFTNCKLEKTRFSIVERCPSGSWCRSRKAVSALRSVGSNPTLSAINKGGKNGEKGMEMAKSPYLDAG